MPKYENRVCEKHGNVPFVLEGSGRFRCTKCRSYFVQKTRDNLKKRAVEYKGGSCQKCGYNKCVAALDFHHLDPNEKDFGIARNGYTRGWEAIKIEIDKCILVCSNCHRETHFEEMQKKKQERDRLFLKPQSEIIKQEERKYLKETKDKCPICNKEKSMSQKTCSEVCAGKKRRKVDWDNIDLKDMYEKTPNMVALGKLFGVSDNAVRKRLKKLGIITAS